MSLTATLTLPAPEARTAPSAGCSATGLAVRGSVNTSDGSAYFSGASALLLDANFVLSQYQPGPVLYGAMHFALGGNLTVAANQGRVILARGGIVKDRG